MNREFKVVGKPVPLVDAREKVEGSAKYSADIHLGGMLHAKTLAFVHPVSKSFLRFEAPIPDDMQNMLDDLKRASV